MFEAKENFLDRVEQSFILFKENFIPLSLPFILFNLLSIVIIPALFMATVFGILPLENLFSGSGQNISIVISLLVTGGIFLAVIYLVFLIPFQIGLIKSIKQALHKETILPKENIFYGFSRLGEIMFKTYWYIFQYVFLIPAIIFITGGFILLFGMYSGQDMKSITNVLAFSIMGFSITLGLIFSLYRGTRSSISIVSAIDAEDFSKENFNYSLSLSKGKAWRIFWNIAGVGILGSLLIGLVSGLGNSIAFLGTDFSSLSQIEDTNNPENIQQIMESFTHFNIFSFINKLFQNILGTILGVFISVFSYILFKRLQQEQKNIEKITQKNAPKEYIEL